VKRILPITAMAAHAIAATDCARRAGQWHPARDAIPIDLNAADNTAAP